MSYGYVTPLARHLQIIDGIAKKFSRELDQLEEFRRLTARCTAQFLSQRGLRPWRSIIVTEVVALVILLPSIALWYAKGLGISPAKPVKVKGIRWNKDPERYKRNPHIFQTPDELLSDAPQTYFVESTYLRSSDIRFILKAARRILILSPFFSFQLIYKISKDIAWARHYIDHHPSEYVLLDTEFDCATSIFTLYLHQHGSVLYNVMHGDKFKSAMDAFFEVDRCYCWNAFYIDIFKAAHARADFRVYTNPNFIPQSGTRSGEGIGVILPITLFVPDPNDIRAFCHHLNALAEKFPVSIRPHPAYAHELQALANHLSSRIRFCNPAQESVRDYLSRHAIIIGTTSTAITESILLGVETLCISCPYVDDLTSYHFMFKQANCHIITIENLIEKAEALLD